MTNVDKFQLLKYNYNIMLWHQIENGERSNTSLLRGSGNWHWPSHLPVYFSVKQTTLQQCNNTDLSLLSFVYVYVVRHNNTLLAVEAAWEMWLDWQWTLMFSTNRLKTTLFSLNGAPNIEHKLCKLQNLWIMRFEEMAPMSTFSRFPLVSSSLVWMMGPSWPCLACTLPLPPPVLAQVHGLDLIHPQIRGEEGSVPSMKQ